MKGNRRLLIVLVLFLSILPVMVQARGSDNKKFGLGVNLGEPLGYDGRYYLADQFSIDLAVGYGFGEEAFIVQPSLLFHLRNILDYDGPDWSAVPYFGAGLKTGVDVAGPHKDSGIAAMRFPVGNTFVMKRGKFEISLEFAPGVEFTPETEFDATGGVGLRYYFF